MHGNGGTPKGTGSRKLGILVEDGSEDGAGTRVETQDGKSVSGASVIDVMSPLQDGCIAAVEGGSERSETSQRGGAVG